MGRSGTKETLHTAELGRVTFHGWNVAVGCKMVLRHREHRRCSVAWHRRIGGDDCTDSKLEFRFGSAIELLVDRWVVAVKLDVG